MAKETAEETVEQKVKIAGKYPIDKRDITWIKRMTENLSFNMTTLDCVECVLGHKKYKPITYKIIANEIHRKYIDNNKSPDSYNF